MALSKSEFLMLSSLIEEGKLSQRKLAKKLGVSLGTANAVHKKLVNSGYISKDGEVQNDGLLALEPYRVNNAIILAAGASTRFAPISYDKPKGVLKARGEVLIERQIRQLKEAGIDDIVVVIGFKKEYFFYLEKEFDVKLIVSADYASRNSHASVLAARDYLGNSYICSSDNYYIENLFHKYEWKSFYNVVFQEGKTEEYCVELSRENRITSVTAGGSDSFAMYGHAYFDCDFSQKLAIIIESGYNMPLMRDALWEDFFALNVDKLDMEAKKVDPGIIFEFDYLAELSAFDPHFIENVDSSAIENIVGVLGCDRLEIEDFYPLKEGLTNLSCHFRIGDDEYVYRHPGIGTDELINRESEIAALKAAQDIGIDSTFVYEDPDSGWKLSRYVKDARPLDAHNPEELRLAMEMARKLHESDVKLDIRFDFFDEGLRYVSLLPEGASESIPRFNLMKEKASELHDFVTADNALQCLCHNDYFESNFLVSPDGRINVIDWEYAGIGDYANDIGTFTVCSKLSHEEFDSALEFYFGRNPSEEERRHVMALVGLAAWCWSVWAIYKESQNDNTGDWMLTYMHYAREYVNSALEMYRIA